MAHFFKGEAQRFELPGLMAFNFLFADALGGGGIASLRYDPQGKMLAQILMDFPLSVPKSWVSGDASQPLVAITANDRPWMAGPGVPILMKSRHGRFHLRNPCRPLVCGPRSSPAVLTPNTR